jgi:hypothetical protein
MCLFEREERMYSHQGGRHDQYRRWIGAYPDRIASPTRRREARFGEVVLLSRYLRQHGILSKISEQVRFARKRFGRYEVIDFLTVQIALRHQRRAHPGGVL